MAILNKVDVLKQVVLSAKKYKANLVGKNFLIVSKKKNKDFKYWELKFEKKQFAHLTGLQTKISSKYFYEKATKSKLSIKDFELREDGTTELKLEVLPLLMDFKDNVRVIGYFEDCSPRLMTDVLAGNHHGALGFVMDEKEDLIPNTCLKCNTRNRVDSERIVMILSKKFTDKEYNNIEYIATHNFNIDYVLQSKSEFTDKVTSVIYEFKEQQKEFTKQIKPKELEVKSTTKLNIF